MSKKKGTRCKAKNFKDCFECPWPDCIRRQNGSTLKGEGLVFELCNPPKDRLISDEYTEDYDMAHETK